MDEIRLWNKKNIENYIEIYVKSDITTIIKERRKRVYKISKKNIVGIDIKPEFPKKPDIVIKNYFKSYQKVLKVVSSVYVTILVSLLLSSYTCAYTIYL